MAVSNYLAFALFNSLFFFGFGLGLLGRVGSAACVAIALAFFGFQCVLSAWWLRRFQYGPVEWLWRAWTYRRWPAWRVTA
jgi:uncharacterized protein